MSPAVPTTVAASSAPAVRRAAWWWELVAIAWLYLVYDAINNLSPIRQQTATDHAGAVLRLESLLHLQPEAGLNAWLAGHTTLGLWLSNFYDVAHIWGTLAVLVWLWWARPEPYRPLRNSLVVMNVIGFVTFWTYPLAPPRMAPGAHYVDVVAQTHAWGSWHDGTLATHANQLAAMPSLHVAWALWCAVALFRHAGGVWRSVGVAHVGLTVYVVLATGNHYTLDVAGGALTAVAAFAVAAGIERATSRRRAAKATMALAGSSTNADRARAI